MTMGVTYQTPNRQRRTVMTAPLSLPPVEAASVIEPAPVQPVPVMIGVPVWRVALAVGAAVAGATFVRFGGF